MRTLKTTPIRFKEGKGIPHHRPLIATVMRSGDGIMLLGFRVGVPSGSVIAMTSKHAERNCPAIYMVRKSLEEIATLVCFPGMAGWNPVMSRFEGHHVYVIFVNGDCGRLNTGESKMREGSWVENPFKPILSSFKGNTRRFISSILGPSA